MKIATGGENKGKVKNVEIAWSDLSAKLTTHAVGDKGKKFFVGGHFQRDVREDSELIARTLLTFDVDNAGMTLDSIEYLLTMNLDCAFAAYSTHSHTVASPRLRIVIPLSREITGDEYRVLSRSVGASLGIPLDECSFKPNQLMYTPSMVAGADVWSMVGEGEFYPVPDFIATPKVEELDDLSAMVAALPLDITDVEVDATLSAYSATGLDYDAWLKCGMALYHQFLGSKVGFARWVAWSKLDAERFDDGEMASKWKSFGGSDKPVTMASIIYHVKQAGGITAIPNAFEKLLDDASNVETFEQFNDFKKRIISMPGHILPPAQRSGVISELADGFGKLNKVTKTAISKEVQPSKKAQAADGGSPPAWLKDWVYVENTCSFANFEVSDYDIRREAFNAKFDREVECIIAEKAASQLALVEYRLPTVVDTMFFPRASKFFEYEGKRMMNSFSAKGVRPVDVIDSVGQAGVDLFMAHVRFTLESEVERELLINWMAYIYQNQGKRVGWAMLLQGAQGSGKSYFGNVFEMLMGTNVKSLDTQAISGRFTGWATGSLVTVVEEIRIAGTNKYEILDKLKPIISNATIQIEEKGRDHRTVPNFTSYFLLTNHKDAVPLQDGDRRYCALFSRVQSEEQLFDELGGQDAARVYFDTLFDSARANAGSIARFLLDWKIPSSFDPQGRAPETAARLEMKALSVSPERDMVDDAISENTCSVINDDILDVTWLSSLVTGMGGELPKTRTLGAILSEMGYSPIDGRRVKVGVQYHYVWERSLRPTDKILDVKKIVKEYHSAKNDGDYENIPF
jgi:hypothetical protein